MPTLTLRHFTVVAAVLAVHAGLLWMLEKHRPTPSIPSPLNAAVQPLLVQADLVTAWSAVISDTANKTPDIRPTAAVEPARASAPAMPSPARATTTENRPATSHPHDRHLPPPEVMIPAEVESEAGQFATRLATTPSTLTNDDHRQGQGKDQGQVTMDSGPTIHSVVSPPSAAASHLNNPPPRYPTLSRRLGEEGQVVLRVHVEVDGTASQATISTSSGFNRLDQAALQTVLRWRYVPGSHNGVPQAMWFYIPIHFVLE